MAPMDAPWILRTIEPGHAPWRIDVALGRRGPGRVVGEDVQAVAFVEVLGPAPSDADEGAAGRWRRYAASYGGVTPPSTFDDGDAFARWLKGGSHAGALAVLEPTLWLDDAGEPCGVSLSVLDSTVGAGFASDGEHRASGPVDDEPRVKAHAFEGGVRVVHWQRFDLRFDGAFDGRFEPGGLAAWGWLRVTYDLRADGTSRAFAAASYLPTCWFYRDGIRVHRVEPQRRARFELDAVLVPREGVPTGSTWTRIDTSTGLVHARADGWPDDGVGWEGAP